MTLTPAAGLLTRAACDRRAVAAFSTYNLELTQAICRAAEQQAEPIILQAGSSAFTYADRDALASIALDAASRADVEVGVHLDHSRDLGEIEWCLARGYTSVMFDGSALPFADNVALTRQAAERAHQAGAWIEAELGPVSGDEDVSHRSSTAIAMTDPGQVAEFVHETGVDALAVAVGNVHGIPDTPVELDIPHLREIASVCSVPLVLHGASGLPDNVISAAIGCGVAKLNFNTELREAFLTTLRSSLTNDPGQAGYGLSTIMEPARVAVAAVASRKIELLANRLVSDGR